MDESATPILYHNRELSWLKFNQRVLEQACDCSIPLLERLKFISIFVNNLDEFFMIRVGTLTDSASINPMSVDNKSLMSPAEQLSAIFAEVRKLTVQKDEAYQALTEDLAAQGIVHLDAQKLTEEQETYLESYYKNEVLPMLSPQIIDKHHPFPFLKNKETYICIQLQTKGEFIKLAIIPASTGFERLVFLPFDQTKFVLVEDLIYKFCDQIFQSYAVAAKTVFRVTRNADINVEEALYDHDMDYRSAMEELVKKRRKLMPVRIEFQNHASDAIIEQLCKKLELDSDRVFITQTPLDFSFGFSFCGRFERIGGENLFYPPLIPQPSVMVEPYKPMIPQIEQHDILLSYPFESMKPFVALLLEAAGDDTVLSIKMTLYRVARESRIVSALIKAAENGKEVHVVVELRARFDEENNIIWSKRLEEAGVNVVYGLGEYKVHSKLLVITRRVKGQLCYITQVGTGNYNESTAKLYTDLCLITAKREFGEDGNRIFTGILTGNPANNMRYLLAAPKNLKGMVLHFIEEQIRIAKQGQSAEIIIKINSLTDKDVIDQLIRASMAGVKIRMIVRGICCLRAGIPGYTDHIQVVSIVGRFLEHSRVYVFRTPEHSLMFLSSADFMTRNTERRVEVAAPVLDPYIKERILAMLELEFSDNVKAQYLLPNGEYARVQNDQPPIDSQIGLFEIAYLRKDKQQTQSTEQRVFGHSLIQHNMEPFHAQTDGKKSFFSKLADFLRQIFKKQTQTKTGKDAEE